MRYPLLAVLIALSSSAAATATAADSDTANIIAEMVARKNARFIYMVTQGQYYHRYDHQLSPGLVDLTPEAAIERGYSRCPECLPPRSTGELNDELASGGPKLSRYYEAYLRERSAPTTTNVPPGTLPVADPPPRAAAPISVGVGGGGTVR